MALSAALEQCKSELETLKNNSIKTGPSTVKGKEVLGKCVSGNFVSADFGKVTISRFQKLRIGRIRKRKFSET